MNGLVGPLCKPPEAWSATDDSAAWPFTRLMFECARIAYEPKAKGVKSFATLGLEAQFIQRQSMQAYAVQWAGDAIVAFRGTEMNAVGDILHDLKFIRRNTAKGGLHAGFADGYAALHDRVTAFLHAAAPRRIWLTGHSLGGALAVVGAYRLIEADILPVAGVITFGQPMVVSTDLAITLDPLLHDRYVSFVNGNDLIYRVIPPYIHFGRGIRFREGAFERWDARPACAAAAPEQATLSGRHPLDEPLSETEVDAIIAQLERQQTAATDKNADTRWQGMLLPWGDHSLAAYATLVAQFLERA